MENFSVRFADFLEDIAKKARSLTVDRLARVITITAAGIIAFALVLVALILLGLAIFRLLAVAVDETGAYTILGGLFVIAGWFFWRKRNQMPKDSRG
jgi:LPXTG-motif cell wall-anchored protein